MEPTDGAPLPPTGPMGSERVHAPRPRIAAGARLGPYEIVGHLGAGGMGEVFRALDARLGREVAIKVLPSGRAEDPGALRRFEIEARAAGSLSHPNIVTIHDVGMDGDTPYVVSELVDGTPLSGPLPAERARDVARQICAGLAAAHDKGIVHRDLKPANLLVTGGGVVKILDFGLAKLVAAPPSPGQTEAGAVMGTPGYMSPEQLRGGAVDRRSDLFSLGVVLYELLSGRRPFPGDSAADRMAATLEREPPSLAGVPAGLARVVARCLEKDPARRYQSARELAAALESGDEPRPRRSRLRALAIAGLGLLVAGGVLAYVSMRPTASAPIRSLAVLPFRPLVSGQADEALELGMADTLIARLGTLRALRVRPISAVRRYAGRDADAIAAGREQQVDAVLDGSIQKAGDTIRVTVRLVKVADQSTMWSDRFDTRATGIFAVQDSIAERVAAALEARLTAGERAALTRRYTEDPEAYQLFLLGRYHLNRLTDEGFWKALDYFKRAIDRDAGYAAAYAGVAEAYTYLGGFGTVAPDESFPRAKQAAEEALRLDDGLAEAHAALASVALWYDWSWSQAEVENRRAIALDPGSADAHTAYGVFLGARGRFEEALREAERALELDPLSMARICGIGDVFFLARRFDEASAQYRRALEMDPNFGIARWSLGRSLTELRRYDEAVPELRRAIGLSGESPDEPAELGRAYALAGKREEALRIAEQLGRRAESSYVAPSIIASIHAALGDRDTAFAWLERGRVHRDFLLVLLEVEPMFDPLRADPRFASLLASTRHR